MGKPPALSCPQALAVGSAQTLAFSFCVLQMRALKAAALGLQGRPESKGSPGLEEKDQSCSPTGCQRDLSEPKQKESENWSFQRKLLMQSELMTLRPTLLSPEPDLLSPAPLSFSLPFCQAVWHLNQGSWNLGGWGGDHRAPWNLLSTADQLVSVDTCAEHHAVTTAEIPRQLCDQMSQHKEVTVIQNHSLLYHNTFPH